MTTYRRSLVESHPDFRPMRPSATLKALAVERGWSGDLAERLLAVGVADGEAAQWARTGTPGIADLERWVTRRELTLDTTLNVRLATWNDADLVTTLAADSPEQVGEWEMVVERGPDPFASLRLQEDAYIVLVEDLGFGLGMVVRSTRDTIVGGLRTTVHVASGVRIRRGFRGLGLSDLLMEGAGPAGGRLGSWVYWYVRRANLDERWSERFLGSPRGQDSAGEVARPQPARPPAIGTATATATTLTRPNEGRRSGRVRPAVDADLSRCCELVNRVNLDRDFFLPLTSARLRSRLDEDAPARRGIGTRPVYGWDDFLVFVEPTGEITACAGLWDRGRDVRERWHDPATGSTVVLDPAAVIDVGWASGSEESAAELVGHLLARTAEKGRSGLLIALDDHPELSAALAGFTSSVEARWLVCNPPSSSPSTPHRPYVDLAYW